MLVTYTQTTDQQREQKHNAKTSKASTWERVNTFIPLRAQLKRSEALRSYFLHWIRNNNDAIPH